MDVLYGEVSYVKVNLGPPFAIRCDLAAEQVADLKKAHSSVCYGSHFSTEGPAYVENIPKLLVPFETFLGENPWLAGENITWAGKARSLVFSHTC